MKKITEEKMYQRKIPFVRERNIQKKKISLEKMIKVTKKDSSRENFPLEKDYSNE